MVALGSQKPVRDFLALLGYWIVEGRRPHWWEPRSASPAGRLGSGRRDQSGDWEVSSDVVPCPGAESTESVPPTPAMRSVMFV